jgi:hypothetical protein
MQTYIIRRVRVTTDRFQVTARNIDAAYTALEAANWQPTPTLIEALSTRIQQQSASVEAVWPYSPFDPFRPRRMDQHEDL